MNLLDLLQMTKSQPVQQAENSLGPIMQFLSQHHSRPMQPLQMPDLPDHSGMIMQAGLQRQAQKDQYAAHLKAKADLEAQQARAIAGHETQLSEDPQIQAMLASGNPQLVAYAMKLAEDETQKKLAARYNENPTYQKWLNASPEERQLMEQYLRTKTPSTNVYTDNVKPPIGYRWANEEHSAVEPLIGGPADVAAQPLTESQQKAKRDYAVMNATSQQVDNFFKDNQGFSLDDISDKDLVGLGLMELDNPLADSMGLTPLLEQKGKALVNPKVVEYYNMISRWNEIFGRDKSGGAIKNPEYRKWLFQYWPWKGDTPEITQNKIAARKAHEAALREGMMPELRQQGVINPYLATAADRLGLPLDHPVVQLAQQGIIPQESGGQANIHDSVDGAKGLMQVMPDTFNQMLPGGNIADPTDNTTAGLKYLLQNWTNTGGDLRATAMNYHGGPNGYLKPNAKDGLGVSNKQYANSVTKKLEAIQTAKQFTRNSPANKDKLNSLQERAKALGW